ncbi:MAG: substrate-binding domain-containing protein [Armatimonadota bacterium]|nr:substrate-binding domain-containing protein [Armatimonadota bacterium]
MGMLKLWLAVAVMAGLVMPSMRLASGAQPRLPPEVDEWLRIAQLGPYAPPRINWDAVYYAARREGKVVVYTSSSRVPALKQEFEARYPGVQFDAYHLGTAGSIDRLEREQRAGIYNADVIHASGYPAQYHRLYLKHMIFPFVPPELVPVIPRERREPLVAQRFEARGIFYNSRVYREPPIKSLWDLTRPEWRGKLAMVDPMVDESTLDFITTIVASALSLARDYERVFGQKLRLTTPNAGYELLKGILANRPRFYRRHGDMAPIVGDPNATDPPLGISMVFSQLRDIRDPARGNLQFWPVTQATPFAAMSYLSLMNIAYRAPHPNAAKLAVRFFFGDTRGGQGFAPFHIAGNWPVRTDVKPPDDPHWIPYEQINFKMLDYIAVWRLQAEVQNWWIANVR